MDPAVNERRLRSVFDAIDIGNNKKALQEVEKVLKKTPTLSTAIALKCLALIRLGRERESQTFIEELEQSEPDDDSTLQVMTYCYRELEQLDKICKIYHNAAKKQPGNDEILSQLFMAHVRVNDYKSQQTVAFQLYKAKPKNPYYFWAVMSIVLQAVRGPESKDPVKSVNLMKLAQGYIGKLVKEKKIEAEQEVQLYLNVLDHQQKYDEALDFLESDICKEFFPGAPIALKIELLKKLGRWREQRSIIEGLLDEDCDRWDYWQDYLKASFELLDDEFKVETIAAFIATHQEKSKSKLRGPFLARFEMHKMMCDRKLDALQLLGDYADLLVEFFKIFGQKKCCANDLKLFIEYLEPTKRAELASRLVQETGISSTTLPQDKDQLQRHICSLQISRFCGAHSSLSVEHLQAIYSAFSLHYEHSYSAYDANLLPTDIGISDQYALLAAYVMYDLAAQLNSSSRLVEILHLLNYLLRNSPSNFHAKLLCLQIYQMLGCTLGAHKIYQSLDIKHVQLDSLGYLHCAHLPITGIYSMVKPIHDQTLKFFTASYKDSLEYLAMCYKYGSFSKLQEFMDFRERLSNSLHYSTMSVEALIQEIVCFNGSCQQYLNHIQNMRIEPSEDRIKYEELMDNRDLDVMIRWDPTFKFTSADHTKYESFLEKYKDMGKENFNQDLELLQIRSTLLRLVAYSMELIHLSPATTNGHSEESKIENHGENFRLLLQRWKELFILAKKLNRQPPSSEFLVNLLPSRLHNVLQLPYEPTISALCGLVQNLWIGSDGAKKSANDLGKAFEVIRNLLSDLQPMTDENGPIFYYRNMQSQIVGCVEILSLCLPVLLNCHDKFNQNQAQTGGKKKKQSNSGSTTNHIDALSSKEKHTLVVEALRDLRVTLGLCEQSLVKLKPFTVDKTLEEYLSTLSITPKPPKSINTSDNANSVISTADIDVHSIFDESYQLTLKEMSSLLKEKMKMISVK